MEHLVFDGILVAFFLVWWFDVGLRLDRIEARQRAMSASLGMGERDLRNAIVSHEAGTRRRSQAIASVRRITGVPSRHAEDLVSRARLASFLDLPANPIREILDEVV